MEPLFKSDVNVDRSISPVSEAQVCHITPHLESLLDLLVHHRLGQPLGAGVLGHPVRQIK